MIKRAWVIMTCLVTCACTATSPPPSPAPATQTPPAATAIDAGSPPQQTSPPPVANDKLSWQQLAQLPNCDECEHMMGMPSWSCAGGVTGGPTCKRMPSGDCGQVVIRCPKIKEPSPPQIIVRVTREHEVCGGAAGSPCRTRRRPYQGIAVNLIPVGQTQGGYQRTTDAKGVARFQVRPEAFRIELAKAIPSSKGFQVTTSISRPTVTAVVGTTDEVDIIVRRIGKAPSAPGSGRASPGTRCSKVGARKSGLVCTPGCPFGPATWKNNPKPCRKKCLAPGTTIATPRGPVAVEKLRIGQMVWAWDAQGQRRPRPVVALQSVPASASIDEYTLADGRRIRVSAEHPSATGVRLGEVRVGEPIDGSNLLSRWQVENLAETTYDLLLDRGGLYAADGVRLPSTMER